LALVPTLAWGQGGLDYSSTGQPEPIWPLPLYHDVPKPGGFYSTGGEFLYWPQTTPSQNQATTAPTTKDLMPQYQDLPEKGGFFASGSFLYWRQTNPLMGHWAR
jgi:hypothetical protein